MQSHISHLPDEILLQIFLNAAELDSRRYDLRMRGVSYLQRSVFQEWTLTHVCQRWRAVALACSKLWTRIPFNYVQWPQEYLMRSGNAPLVVELHKVSSMEKERLNSLVGHLQRIDELRIVGSQHVLHLYEVMRPLAEGSPSLKVLDLFQKDYNDLPTIMLSSPSRFPALTQVRITGGLVPGGIIFPSTLTVLDMRDCHLSPSLHLWVKAIAPCQNLAHLHIEHRLPNLDPSVTLAAVNFPWLQTLFLEGPPEVCAQFFQHLIIPTTTRVHICCHKRESPTTPQASQYINLLSLLSSHVSDYARPDCVLVMHVSQRESVVSDVRFWLSVAINPASAWATPVGEPHLRISVLLPIAGFPTPDWHFFHITSLLSALSFKNVHAVGLDYWPGPQMSKEAWGKMLRVLPIETLVSRYKPDLSLLEALNRSEDFPKLMRMMIGPIPNDLGSQDIRVDVRNLFQRHLTSLANRGKVEISIDESYSEIAELVKVGVKEVFTTQIERVFTTVQEV